MNDNDFTPKVLENTKQIEAKTSAIANLVPFANNMLNAFTNLFGYFKLADLIELINSHEKDEWILQKWIELKHINIGGFNIKAVLGNNLIDLPDSERLKTTIQQYKHRIGVSFLDQFIKTLDEIYDESTGKFVDPIVTTDDSIILKRIQEQFSVKTESQNENDYISLIESIAEGFEVLLNTYRMPPQSVPAELFEIRIMKGFKTVSPSFDLLKRIRKGAIKV